MKSKLYRIYTKYSMYHVYPDGRVYSLYKKRYLKPGLSSNGYLTVCLHNNVEHESVTLHSLLAKLYIPNPENKTTVNHKDGNKLNNSLDNLEWATPKEQNAHIAKLELKPVKRIVWYHNVEGTHTLSAQELIEKFPSYALSQEHLSDVSLGKRKHHKDWRVV